MNVAPGALLVRAMVNAGTPPPRVWVAWAPKVFAPRSQVLSPAIVVAHGQYRPGEWDWSMLRESAVEVLDLVSRGGSPALWRLVAELAAVSAPVAVACGVAGAEDWPYEAGEIMRIDAGEALYALRTVRDGQTVWPPGWSAELDAAYAARLAGERMARAA